MSKRRAIPDVMSRLQGLGTPPPLDPILEPIEEELATVVPQLRPVRQRPSTHPAPSRAHSAKNRTPKKRLVGRATYDIGQDLKEALRQESIDLGVPASQFAKYLLLYAWEDYSNGGIPAPALLRSNSPKFRNTIDFE